MFLFEEAKDFFNVVMLDWNLYIGRILANCPSELESNVEKWCISNESKVGCLCDIHPYDGTVV